MTGHGILILVAVFQPPKKKLLRGDLEALFALGDAVILFGDFNSKSTNWKCNYFNRNDRKWWLSQRISISISLLHSFRLTTLMMLIVGLISYAFMKGVSPKVSCIEPLQCLNSDHRPVLMRVSLLPEDDLDPMTQEEVSKHIKAFKIRETPEVDSISIRPIRVGVPQGSTLSPLLCSAYVNDIPRPKTGVQLALYSDDTALFLRSNCLRNILPRLQRAIDELTQWLRLWRIEVNPKSQHLFTLTKALENRLSQCQ
ncbi:Probable RNA-directed DNA polymerase from transposon BS [Eumeta japonica]|uniref:Probable RNA-directed DNA polymerase from transposon BS n=1 Tax=Eumeta variegata TaxID=151549 RepID=A0A4C1ZNK7_EUMVA|nr:Probable RNA-directed DNA polymerase from transposon BS [Eumeta japonica]